jgi:hypothetical protein
LNEFSPAARSWANAPLAEATITAPATAKPFIFDLLLTLRKVVADERQFISYYNSSNDCAGNRCQYSFPRICPSPPGLIIEERRCP